MNILVTGGAGYIGSHVCKALFAKGMTPVVYDNLSRGNREAVQWGPLEIGDIADTKRLREVLLHYRPAALITLPHSLTSASLSPIRCCTTATTSPAPPRCCRLS